MSNARAGMRISILQGRGGLSEAEIAMATPDTSEAKDLVVHVERCAKRFKLLAESQNEMAQDLNQCRVILILGIGYLVLVSQPAQNVLDHFLKIFGG